MYSLLWDWDPEQEKEFSGIKLFLLLPGENIAQRFVNSKDMLLENKIILK